MPPMTAWGIRGENVAMLNIITHLLKKSIFLALIVAMMVPVNVQAQYTSKTVEEPRAERSFMSVAYGIDDIIEAMMMFADQMSAVAMQQAFIFGTFLDAKHQLETQRVLQNIRARTHKDYHPSMGVCEFGSTMKSLAASERKSELVAHVLSQRSQDRNLANTNTTADQGPSSDKNNRLEQYKTKFCDPSDSNNTLSLLCPGGGATKKERVNKDIDFVRTVEYPWTLDIDLSDTSLTENEEEIFALASNLYGFDVFKNISTTDFMSDAEAQKLRDNPNDRDANIKAQALNSAKKSYMDARAVLAKRSVAENSFNAITSMKASGTDASREFLEIVLEELGASTEPKTTGNVSEINRMLGINAAGRKIAPSYYAQMEILTKKIYQNPDFYTNLYDKPANVDRKHVAMQAIGLMQKFDLYKSYLRTEANISVLLELAVEDLQNKAADDFASRK